MSKPSPPASGSSPILNMVEWEEVRIEGTKISLPVNLKGGGDDNIRAISFYSASGKLEAAAKDITAQGRIKALAANCNLSHIADLNVQEMIDAYQEQLFTPSK